MSAELDMSQYLELFLTEAQEQLQVLEKELLELEKSPTDDRLQVIFRAAHTLKGSSRAMGFSFFAELTHEMENILDQLRQHTLSISPVIADSLLACSDMLAQMAESIGEGQGDKIDCAELLATLKEIGGSSESSPAATSGTTLHVEHGIAAPSEGFPSTIGSEHDEALLVASQHSKIWHAKFRLTKDCVMKYVRAFMAISLVQDSGEILVCQPTSEALEEEAFETDFEIVFTFPGDIDQLRSEFKNISELEDAWLNEWKPASKSSEAAIAPVLKSETAAPAPDASPAKKVESGQTVRVDVARLDSLMNLVGELVIDRTRIARIGSDLSNKLRDPLVEALSETVGHIARITSDLQDQIMKARMMPIESVFNRFPRVVRDLAKKLDKKIELEIFGGETELDRSVIEVIGDPLLHMLRNSVDHGIESPAERVAAGKPESGRVTLSARHQENHIVIEIVDDGKGIDAERLRKKAISTGLYSSEQAAKLTDKEAVNLIFHSVLSTAAEISEVSGRGVGMDIVRSNIQKLGGLIDIETTVGQGTRFMLRLPLTLAIIRGLLVNVTSQVFVIPLGSVIETLLVQPKDIQKTNKHEVIVLRGVTVPLVRLQQRLHNATKIDKKQPAYVVIVGLAQQRVGLVVDDLIGEQEVVIKSLSRYCGEVQGVSGATILGDGNVALIIDVNSVVENADNRK